MNERAKELWRTAVQNEDKELLLEAISCIQSAAILSECDPEKQAGYLNNEAVFLSDLASMETKSVDALHTLEKSIRTVKKGIPNASANQKSTLLLTLGNALRKMNDVDYNSDRLDEAISKFKEGLENVTTPSNEPKLLSGLSASLMDTYLHEEASKPDDLRQAISVAMKAVDISDDTHPYRAEFLDTYAITLYHRFNYQEASMGLLNHSIEISEEAVGLAEDQMSAKTLLFISNLAGSLLTRYQIQGSVVDLDRALAKLNSTHEHINPSNEVWRFCSLTLARALLCKYERDGEPTSLDCCIQKLSDLNGWMPQESQSTLGYALIRRFDVYSKIDDIDNAVKILKITAQDLREGITSFYIYGNLATALLARFELRGSTDDLLLAQSKAKKALDVLPNTSRDYSIALTQYADVLLRSFERKLENGEHDEQLLKEVISYYERAVADKFVWRSKGPGRLTTLVYALQLHCSHFQQQADWSKCLKACKDAISASENDSTRHIALGQTGGAFLARARSNLDDIGQVERNTHLRQAIEYLQQALDKTPSDHSSRAMWLNNLGLAYETQFRSSSELYPGSYEEGLARYIEAANLRSASPFQRITAVYRALEFADRLDLEQLSALAWLAVNLIPTLSPRMLQRQDQERMISMFSNLGSYCAAILLESKHNVVDAINALETSRGVISNLLLDTRNDLTVVKEHDELLAAEFADISSKLESNSAELSRLNQQLDSNWDMSSETRIKATKAFDTIIDKIRNLEGCSGFLQRPDSEALQVLAGSSYIVVVNVASFRCDALFFSSNRIGQIWLSELNRQEAVDRANALTQAIANDNIITRSRTNAHFRELLGWLWKTLVKPIQTELQKEVKGKIRICWVPTGVMTNFPIHAAADDTSNDNAMDTIISSYSTTISAIRFHKKKINRRANHNGQALLVSMNKTPDQLDLSFAEEEATIVHNLLQPPMQRTTRLSYPCTQPETSGATKDRVLSELRSAAIAHLSCHGIANYSEPSSSQLLLSDWQSDPLTVANITMERLPYARVAYLSACHAAVNRNASLLDEGIHLAGAFQLAGFPQVVGSLWQVNDRRAMQVSQRVWENLISENGTIEYERLGDALNLAMVELRQLTKQFDDEDSDDEYDDEPFIWAPFVYLGL